MKQLVSRKPTIVGVDPGDTTGIAILGIDGEILSTKSLKKPHISGVLDYILAKGVPVIIAVDKQEAPKLVYRLAAILKAVVFSPKQDLTREEKRALLLEAFKGVTLSSLSQHEKDALAAAYKAYKANKNLLLRVEAHSMEKQGKACDERVKVSVIKGSSIHDAIIHVGERSKKEKRKRPLTRKVMDEKTELISRLEFLARELKKEKAIKRGLLEESRGLRKRIAQLEEDIDIIRRRLREKIQRDAIIAMKNREIKGLKDILRREQAIRERWVKKCDFLTYLLKGLLNLFNTPLIPVCEDLTSPQVEASVEMFKWLKPEHIYAINPFKVDAAAVNSLKRAGIRKVLVEISWKGRYPEKAKTLAAKLRPIDLLFIDKEEIHPIRMGERYIACLHIPKGSKRDLQENKEDWLTKMIDSYRRSRKSYFVLSSMQKTK